MNEPFDISNINEKFLEQCRLHTDPIADQTIAEVISAGFESQINQVFMAIVQNDRFEQETFAPLGDKLGAILFDYFESTCHLPSWADSDLVLKGEEVFASYGPEIFMLLNVTLGTLIFTVNCCGYTLN